MNNPYNWGGPIDYSTNEQVIGKWIDGKPLYQITVVTTNVPASQGALPDVESALVDAETVLKVESAFVVDKGGSTVSEYFVSTADMFSVALGGGSSGGWTWYKQAGRQIQKLCVTVRYTKTTD